MLASSSRFPLSISSEQAAGSLSPSARSEQAGTSLRRAPGREQARPRAGGDERASGREQVWLRALRRRGRACAGQAGELPPGRARVRPGEPPPPPDEAKHRGSKGQGRRRHVLCDFFSFLIMLVMNLCVM